LDKIHLAEYHVHKQQRRRNPENRKNTHRFEPPVGLPLLYARAGALSSKNARFSTNPRCKRRGGMIYC
jgi:hypothetical protein